MSDGFLYIPLNYAWVYSVDQVYILDLLQFNHVRKSRKQSHYIEVAQEAMEQNMRFGLVLVQLAILGC